MKITHINNYLLPFLLLLSGITIGLQRQEIRQPKPPITISQKIGPCNYTINETQVTIDESCLLSPPDALLFYRFIDIIETHRQDIRGFSTLYDDSIERFTYHQASPLWKNTEKQIISTYRKQKIHQIQGGESVGGKITLSRDEREILAMNLYSYFPTDRDISEYGKCSQQNYYVAALSIDKKLVHPEETFNINKRVANRIGYCKHPDDDNPFNGGVCGAATQIFRIGLLHPDLEIIERENHQIRYSKYYGEKIRGDDAGIARFHKNLTLKNNSTSPLYFKYRDQDPDKLVGIVAISPTAKYKGLETTIQKKQLGPLEAEVVSSSTMSGEIYPSRSFHSVYKKVNDELVN